MEENPSPLPIGNTPDQIRSLDGVIGFVYNPTVANPGITFTTTTASTNMSMWIDLSHPSDTHGYYYSSTIDPSIKVEKTLPPNSFFSRCKFIK